MRGDGIHLQQLICYLQEAFVTRDLVVAEIVQELGHCRDGVLGEGWSRASRRPSCRSEGSRQASSFVGYPLTPAASKSETVP